MRTTLPTGIGAAVAGGVMPYSIRNAAASTALGNSQGRGKHSNGQDRKQKRFLHMSPYDGNAVVHRRMVRWHLAFAQRSTHVDSLMKRTFSRNPAFMG